jgi:hypothetical protein
MMVDAFMPAIAGSVTISVGAVSSTTTIPSGTRSTTFPAKAGGEMLELNNTSASVDVFVEVCNAAQIVAATVAASYPVRAGQCKIIKRAPGDDRITAIGAAAGPTNLIVSVGNGI